MLSGRALTSSPSSHVSAEARANRESKPQFTRFRLQLEHGRPETGPSLWQWARSGRQKLPGQWETGPLRHSGRPSHLLAQVALVAAAGALLASAIGPADLRDAMRRGYFRGDAQSRMAPATRFGLGATPEEVRRVQGPADAIRGDTWIYGKSKVHFRFGRVIGWTSAQPVPLKVPASRY